MRESLKQHIFFITLLVIFCLFAANKLFTEKFYTSHDGEGHIVRMEEFHQALLDGQIPVRIAKRINYGLGYPFFNFNYPFVYYLSEGFHLMGFSFVGSFKMIMVLSLLLGAISMYYFTTHYFQRVAAFISALFYIFAPYRFLNMYVRGDMAESLGLALLPFVLFSIDLLSRISRNGKWSRLLFIFAFSLLITSHNITAMIGGLLMVFYALFRWMLIEGKRQRKIFIKHFILGIAFSLMLTAFFWLPVLVEAKLTKLIELTEDYQSFFPEFSELIYSPWGFGMYKQGQFPGKMSSQIGLIHQLGIFLAIFILIYKFFERKKLQEKEKFSLFFVTLSIVSLFLTLPISGFVWNLVFPLKLVQFPWRFVGYIILSFSIATGYFIDNLRNMKLLQLTIVICLVFLVVYANRNHIRVNMYFDYVSPFKRSQIYGPSTTSKDEHMPKWASRVYTAPNPNGEVISEVKGTSERAIWKSNYHLFELNLKNSAYFRDNTSYFPGWIAKIDGKKVEVLYNKDEFGRLRIYVPAGRHKVEFFFKETGYRLIADLVSLFTFVIVGIVYPLIVFTQKYRTTNN